MAFHKRLQYSVSSKTVDPCIILNLLNMEKTVESIKQFPDVAPLEQLTFKRASRKESLGNKN